MSQQEMRAEGLRQGMQKLVESLDKTMRPIQKDAYLCMAQCTDKAGGPAELQQCVSACERRVQGAEQLTSAALQDFHSKVQRCVAVCHDRVQGMLSPQPSDKEIGKAQDFLSKCAADCAVEYERLLPKLQKDLQAQIKKL